MTSLAIYYVDLWYVIPCRSRLQMHKIRLIISHNLCTPRLIHLILHRKLYNFVIVCLNSCFVRSINLNCTFYFSKWIDFFFLLLYAFLLFRQNEKFFIYNVRNTILLRKYDGVMRNVFFFSIKFLDILTRKMASSIFF